MDDINDGDEMKLSDTPNDFGSRLRSEGKVLELTPMLYLADGSVLALPPVTYDVPNWLLGMDDNYIMGYPYNIHPMGRDRIDNGSAYVSLAYVTRIYERQPDSTPVPSTIAVDDVLELARIQREMNDQRRLDEAPIISEAERDEILKRK